MGGAGSGRPAEPINLKVLKGRRPGKGSDGMPLPKIPSYRRLAPEKPADLSAEASAHWDAVVPDLQRLEILKPGDLGALVMLCETWATWKATTDPYRQLLASKEYRQLAVQFGLTPASESKVKAKEANDGQGDNPFAPRPADLARGS